MTKVLIVDDSSTMIKILRNIVREGFVQKEMKAGIYEAHDGEMALEIMEEHGDIDIVITDINMPNLDGVKLIEKLTETKKAFPKEIIVVSLNADEDVISKVRALGVKEYIKKPFKKADIYRALFGVDNPVNLEEKYDEKDLQEVGAYEKYKILVVEDSRTMSEILKKSLIKMFERMGVRMEVDIAINGAEALNMLIKDSDYQLIISDINMPVLDGSEFIKVVNNIEITKDIPVLAMSVSMDELKNIMNPKKEIKINGLLQKPFTNIRMSDEIKKILKIQD